MFLNIYFPSTGGKAQKSDFKPYWVEIHEPFLDISAEYAKEPFTSFHLGVLKVAATKDFSDRPDVLEFTGTDNMTSAHFYVFTYDPFDILDFYKMTSAAIKKWKEQVAAKKEKISFQAEVKPTGISIFKSNFTWSVQPDKVSVGKGSQASDNTLYNEIVSLTPIGIPSKPATFKFVTKQSPEGNDQRCTSVDQMKGLMNAVFNNWYLLKCESKPPK
ncbi:hypothetical protein TRFO_28842 [Tritrichomonas foetus]|uniref:Uncharacterized protein n=1 Tax=Tritrichomonas foetus TaxID=1144522 RepID=A0A1J4K2E3_9EUKA|nr:hypothetical protein TRFO_28842 [Tritrichomonas foetus]|eukprot:OHT03661.1 hypothetical protein TRFO_28842 [Tritrichomonas foetus]